MLYVFVSFNIKQKNMKNILKLSLIFFVTSSIPFSFLIVGILNFNNNCNKNEDFPSLALYLIIQNGTYVLQIAIVIVNNNSDGRTMTISAVALCIIILFNVTWNVVGAISLEQDQFCKTYSPGYFNVALVCNMLNYISFFGANNIKYKTKKAAGGGAKV